MENKQTNKRMLSQDIAKGLCVLGIVVSHTMALPPLAMAIIFSVFGFALSYFFIISGYNYHGRKVSYGQIIFKRFKQLFIPFFIILSMSIVVYGVIGSAFYGSTFKDIGINILESFTGIHDMRAISPALEPQIKNFFIPIWFIWFMFGGYVIFYAIADWALEKTLRLIFVITGLIAFTFVFSLFEKLDIKFFVTFSAMPFGRMLICSPFVAAQLLLGAYLGKKQIFSLGKEKRTVVIITSLAAFIAATTFGMFFPMVGGFSGGVLNGTLPFAAKFGIWEVLITFVLGFLFTYYFINFCRLVEKVPVLSTWLTFTGQHSMELYLVHFPFSLLVRRLLGLVVDSHIPFPAAFPVETFDIKYLFVFLITLVVCEGGIYLYVLIKKTIKNKKATKNDNQQVSAA